MPTCSSRSESLGIPSLSYTNQTLDSFANVFNKLIELGVPTAQFQSDAYTLKTLDEQS